MLTAFLAQGATTALPNTEVAAFGTWQMIFIAIFLATDIILGIASAIASKEFNFNKVAAFMKTGVIPYIFGFAVVEFFASGFGLLGQIVIMEIFIAIMLNILGSIISNLAKLGIVMPMFFVKKG